MVDTFSQANTYLDDRGNVILSQRLDGVTWVNTVYNYNPYGQLTGFKDPYGVQTDYEIDAWGRINSITDAAGNEQAVEYDICNRTKKTYFIPYGGAAENHYVEVFDQWGRIIARKGFPDGFQSPAIQENYEYDLVGNLTLVTDARGNSTGFQYDALDRIIKVTTPLGEEIDCDYDRLGGLSQIKQYENDKTFLTVKLYDERGLLISHQPPAGNPTTFKYNAAGLPVEITDAAGKTASLSYDGSSSLIEKTVNQNTIKYYYDPLGGIGKYEVWAGAVQQESLSYDYTPLGLVGQRTAGAYSAQFEYDLLGNRTEVTDPFGYAVNYNYDNILHRLQSITSGDKTFTYEYYADGMIQAVNYPTLTGGGTLRTEMTYDNINRLKTLVNLKNGQVISQYAYTYDNNGNIVSVTENQTETTTYTYDALNRLTGITRPDGESIQYIYDSRGNRKQTSGVTLNEQEFIPADFVYNDWDELSAFTNTATSETYTYEYDAEGLRTKKISPTGTIRYHYDNNGRVIAESDASDQVIAQNIWGHKLLARKVDTSYYYYLYNGHGDVVQILDEAGNIVNSYAYDEWGNIRSKMETIANPIRYAGEYFDEESGLYYLRARYYDPSIARFISRDSYEGVVANPLSINQYIYCYNNPLIYCDPSGYYTQLDFSNWTGTAAQAAQLQALYTNYEAYNAGDIDADTARSNYTRIMDDYEKTTNGNSKAPKKKKNNPDPVATTATPTTPEKEAAVVEKVVVQPESKITSYDIGNVVNITTTAEGFSKGLGLNDLGKTLRKTNIVLDVIQTGVDVYEQTQKSQPFWKGAAKVAGHLVINIGTSFMIGTLAVAHGLAYVGSFGPEAIVTYPVITLSGSVSIYSTYRAGNEIQSVFDIWIDNM